MPITQNISRPVLRYQGGKFRIASWIISFFPKHEVYCEPFGGAASVLIQKPSCKTEVYNDINSDLYNLFSVLRDKDKNDALSRRLYFTPWSREEFDNAYIANAQDDDIEKARKIIVRSIFGIGSTCTRHSKGGFKSQVSLIDYKFHSHRAYLQYPPHLRQFYERLRSVVLEHTDAKKVMNLYDTDKTLHYVDPPYMMDTWNKSDAKVYAETLKDDKHVELLEFLKNLKGYVVLSGYNNEIYNAALKGWHTETKTTTNQRNEKRTEKLWISPKTWNALTRRKGLFE